MTVILYMIVIVPITRFTTRIIFLEEEKLEKNNILEK